jgi:hypothetical protein
VKLRIFYRGCTCRWVVTFTHRPLYSREKNHGIHCIRDWEGPRTCLNLVPARFPSFAIFMCHEMNVGSRGSSVSKMSELPAGRPGFNSRQGQKFFLFATASRPTLGLTQPLTQWVLWALSLRVKWLERETNHSSPSSAEAKNARSYTSTPPYFFMMSWTECY